MKPTDTATQLLDSAQDLVQEKGYNAFSYKDLAQAVNIRTASIHYHFPAKADLGQALVERYRAGLEQALADIDGRRSSSQAKLKAFIGLYRETGSRGAICLCGSLASDHQTLPVEVKKAVAAYLERSEEWIARTVSAGVREGEFTFSGKPKEAAASLMAGLQGGLIIARARGGTSVLDGVQRLFLQTLKGS